ncbi:MAG: hypothetical protein WC856_02480 [Methylococcaceae bacterium]
MKYFPPLRTRRLTVQLRELSIGESIKLAAVPVHLTEAACSLLLKYAVETVSGIEDSANWTVQERILVTAHYLSVVATDGPDFSLGQGKYLDYLDGSLDIDKDFKPLELGSVGGDEWSLTHLTGRMAEAIERLSGELADMPPRLHWLIGGMAAQLIIKGEVLPDLDADGSYDEWLLARMKVLAAFPESDFEQLIMFYQVGREQLQHLFKIDFNDDGVIALPKEAGSELPPARFPARSCCGRLALELGQ